MRPLSLTALTTAAALVLFLAAGMFIPARELAVYPHSASSALSSPTRILFVGDMFFDRYIRRMAQIHGEDHLFSCTKELFAQADLVVGNLEGPITDNPSVSIGSKEGSPENFVFTFPTSTATLLKRHNVGIVSLGNNHIENFGAEGIASTHQYLDAAGVGYFGGIAGDEPIYRTTVEGRDFSFIAYNQFGGKKAHVVADDIRTEKSQDRFVVVFAHWGEEYIDSSPALRPIAQLFADAGADLIVGSHPHVVLPHETLGTTPVYYSLGNFIFDQYWEESVRTGLTIMVTLSQNKVDVQEHPVTIERDGRTCPIGD